MSLESVSSAVMRQFGHGRHLTRAELVKATRRSRPTIARALDGLVNTGYLVRQFSTESTGGRRPELFGLNGRKGYFLVADVGGSQSRVGIGDFAGRIVRSVDIFQSVNDGPTPVLERLTDAWQKMATELGIALDAALATCVGLPGPVDRRTGRVVRPPMMIGWDDFDVIGALRAAIDIPTIVDKDTNLMTAGEAAARPDVQDMLVVKVGVGIGAGVVAGGDLVRGATGGAGDLGHLPGRSSAVCRCGQVGCVEAVAGGWAIAERLRAAGHAVTNSADIVALGHQRNPVVLEELRVAGGAIGEAVADAVGLLNPDVVVIGGNLALASDSLISGIRQSIFDRCHPLTSRSLDVVASELREDAGLNGAIIFARQLFLESLEIR